MLNRTYLAIVDERERDKVPENSLSLDGGIRVWSGTRQDLLRLGEVMDQQFAPLRAEVAGISNPKPPGRFWPSWLLPARRAMRSEYVARLRELRSVNLQIADAEKRVIKDHYKLLLENAKTDLQSAVTLTFECGVERNICIVRLTKHEGASAYTVQGDPPWARDTFASVQAELKRAAPTWKFMRHPASAVIPYIFGAVLFYFFIRIDDPIIYAPILVATFVVPTFMWFAIKKLFPAFELREPSQKTRRQSLVRWVGAIATVVTFAVTVAAGLRSVFFG